MPTPKKGYFLADGTRVPGTTTVIGRFKDSGALIYWAYKQGREHEGLARQGIDAPTRLYEVTERYANIGTLAHSMVEAHILGFNPHGVLHKVPESLAGPARQAFGAYLSWAEQTKLKILEQEIQLISEEYKFGGTPDAIGEVHGELCLIDWKTSNNVYSDYLIQIAAYRYLWETAHPERSLTGGFHLCRFAKENGDFSHHFYPDLSEAWTAFKLMRELYDIDKVLKKRA